MCVPIANCPALGLIQSMLCACGSSLGYFVHTSNAIRMARKSAWLGWALRCPVRYPKSAWLLRKRGAVGQNEGETEEIGWKWRMCRVDQMGKWHKVGDTPEHWSPVSPFLQDQQVPSWAAREVVVALILLLPCHVCHPHAKPHRAKQSSSMSIHSTGPLKCRRHAALFLPSCPAAVHHEPTSKIRATLNITSGGWRSQYAPCNGTHEWKSSGPSHQSRMLQVFEGTTTCNLNGYLTPTVSGIHVWAKWRHHHCCVGKIPLPSASHLEERRLTIGRSHPSGQRGTGGGSSGLSEGLWPGLHGPSNQRIFKGSSGATKLPTQQQFRVVFWVV